MLLSFVSLFTLADAFGGGLNTQPFNFGTRSTASPYPNSQHPVGNHTYKGFGYATKFSEEDGGFSEYKNGAPVAGMKCSGARCDDMKLEFYDSAPAVVSNSGQWSDWIAHDPPNGFRTHDWCGRLMTNGYITQMQCAGHRCTYVRFRCESSPSVVLEALTYSSNEIFDETNYIGYMRFWTESHTISEENPNAQFVCGQGWVLTGVGCMHKHCDNKLLVCQRYDPDAPDLGDPWGKGGDGPLGSCDGDDSMVRGMMTNFIDNSPNAASQIGSSIHTIQTMMRGGVRYGPMTKVQMRASFRMTAAGAALSIAANIAAQAAQVVIQAYANREKQKKVHSILLGVTNYGCGCWDACNKQTGYCDFCGTGACCRSGYGDNLPECIGEGKFLSHACSPDGTWELNQEYGPCTDNCG